MARHVSSSSSWIRRVSVVHGTRHERTLRAPRSRSHCSCRPHLSACAESVGGYAGRDAEAERELREGAARPRRDRGGVSHGRPARNPTTSDTRTRHGRNRTPWCSTTPARRTRPSSSSCTTSERARRCARRSTANPASSAAIRRSACNGGGADMSSARKRPSPPNTTAARLKRSFSGSMRPFPCRNLACAAISLAS